MSKRQRDVQQVAQPKKRAKHARDAIAVDDDAGSRVEILHPVLVHKYRRVYSLETYLRENIPAGSRIRQKRLAEFGRLYPAQADFLTTTLVGFWDEPSVEARKTRKLQFDSFCQAQKSALKLDTETTHFRISQIVDFAVWFLFQRDAILSKRPKHILCHGFRRSGIIETTPEEPHIDNVPGVVKVHPNPNIQSLKSAPWTYIVAILGTDAENALLDLLLDCGLFQKLPSGTDNYYQLSGVPLPDLTIYQDMQSENSPLPKDNAQSGVHKPLRRSGEITLVRSRIFYARPSVNRQGDITFGLKHIHVLNRYSRLDCPIQDANVLSYIFPKQFGLHNVFTSSVDKRETTQPFKEYSIREDEIAELKAENTPKIPRRLRGYPLKLVRRIRQNHLRCSYSQLIRQYCPVHQSCVVPPSSCNPNDARNHDYNIQRSFRESMSIKQNIIPHEISEDHSSSFLPHATPAFQVSLFCRSVIRRLLPGNVFGYGESGIRNWNKVQTCVDLFVHMRRFESFTLHEVINGFKLSCVSWLAPSTIKVGTKMSLSDKSKRQELLNEFMYYVFDSLLIPLIRSNFYVTESGIHRNKLFYFRHDVWRKLSEPAFMSMRMSSLRSISAGQVRLAHKSSNLGYSQVRLLPKERGTRPITNLRRRTMSKVNGKPLLGSSINAQLTPVFNVINYERMQNPEQLASALFSVGAIHSRLKSFKDKICAMGTIPLYFIKTDIRSAFDSIPQNNMLRLVDRVFQQDSYQVAKHIEAKWLAQSRRTGTGHAVNRFVGRAKSNDNLPLFSMVEAQSVADRKRKTIFTPTDQQRVWHTSQLKSLLTDHICGNMVKIGRKHFQQTEGIPQGSVLSSFLCNFFYADFEQRCLGFLDPASTLLLRLIDDFLLITTDQDQAFHFLQTMSEGNDFYGITVNADKSLVNFDASVRGTQIPRHSDTTAFPYCGLVIDTQTLQVGKERQHRDLQVGNALTVDVHGRVGLTFRRRILTSLQIQLQSMLLDPCLNSRDRIFRNLLECFGESAMKMHRYRSGISTSRQPRQEWIINIIEQMIDLAFNNTHRMQTHSGWTISRAQVSWLGATAFFQILSPKQAQYGLVLSWLKRFEKSKEYSMNMPGSALKQLLNNGLSAFKGFSY